MDGARPHPTEAPTKMVIPPMMNGLRPNMSESLPTSGTTTVEANRYTVNTHDRSAKPPRSARMRGVAVATMD